MSEVVESVLDLLGDSIKSLLEWFLDFFTDIFTGETIRSFGHSVLNLFINGSFDFSLKSLFELLFGVAFLIFAVKLIIHIIRG